MGLVEKLQEHPRALRFVDKATGNIFHLYKQYLDCKSLETGLTHEEVIKRYDPGFYASERAASLNINMDGAVKVQDPGRYLRASPKIRDLIKKLTE